MAFLKLYSQPLVLISQSNHNCHVHGKLNSLTDIVVCEEGKYFYHWLRVQVEVGSCECIRLIPLISQDTRVRSWDSGHQSLKPSSTSEISPTCNVCLPQTVQAAICRLVCLPDTGWSGGKSQLFQAVLTSWQHRWADLQWVSTIGSLPLPRQFISIKCLTVDPIMTASWSSSATSYRCLRWILDNVIHSYELSFLQDRWRGKTTLHITAGHNILNFVDIPSNMPSERLRSMFMHHFYQCSFSILEINRNIHIHIYRAYDSHLGKWRNFLKWHVYSWLSNLPCTWSNSIWLKN